jgi:uncharacterized protein
MIANTVAGAVRMAILALALAALSAPAHAQQPSANAIAMAREILALKGSAGLYETLPGGVIDRVRTIHLQTNPMLQKPLDEVAASLRKEYLKRATTELGDSLATFYAARFTEAELKTVLAFYKSPAGKKVIDEEPRIFEQYVQHLKDWQDKFGTEVLSRFRIEMKKRGHEL